MAEPQDEGQTQTNQDGASKHGDCYSEGERAWMVYGQVLRGRLLGPWLVTMTRLGVVPDHISIFSVVTGLAFGLCWPLGWKIAALILLLLHVLLDGLDGPLARYQQVESPRGSFTDSFCDQLVVTTVTISLMVGADPYLDVLSGSLFVVLYTSVLAISMVRNSLAIPYSWLVRPRFFVYLAIPCQLLGVSIAVWVVVWVSNFLLLLKLVSGFFRLRGKLEGPHSRER